MEIKAKATLDSGEKRIVTINLPLAENFEDAVAKYGKDVIYKKFIAAVVIDIQGAMRACGKAGLSDKDTEAKLAGFKPGIKTTLGLGGGAPTKESMLKTLANFSPEDKAAFAAELKKILSK
jgi:hypothetical protein